MRDKIVCFYVNFHKTNSHLSNVFVAFLGIPMKIANIIIDRKYFCLSVVRRIDSIKGTVAFSDC